MKQTVVLAVAVLASVWSVSLARKPNIIVILVDDLGFNDLGIQGSPDVKSPHIDKLMRDGVRFDDAYSCAGFCSPARAGLLTGIHPFHIGHWYNPPHDPEDTHAGIPHDYKTIAHSMKNAGYKSIAIGKWHLGFTFKHHPMKLGFDHFFGFLGGKFDYKKSVYKSSSGVDQYIYDDWKKWDGVTYLTDDWTNKAMDFLTKHKNEKMFIYLAYNTVHGPFQAKPEDFDPSVPEPRRKHVAMIKNLDDNIKRLRNKLSSLGIAKDTAIFFTNDNGGHPDGAVNYPLRDFKGELYEGGVRVPLSLTYPRKIKANKTCPMLVSIIDIYPTCQSLVGQQIRGKLEGVNLMPYIHQKGNSAPQRPVNKNRAIINRRAEGNGTVRKGDWKIFFGNTGGVRGMWNLKDDIGEQNDLQGTKPALQAKLTSLFQQWNALSKPMFFPPSFGGSQKADNPVTLKLNVYPSRIKVGQKVTFKSQGSHKDGKKLSYRWSVFEPSQEVFAFYNNYKKHPGVTVATRWNKNTKITFAKAGTLIVQIRAFDGRFLKIINKQYTVTN